MSSSMRKLVLVDELDREYKRLQRPVDAVAKASRSLRVSDTLRRPRIADDQKVRDYVNALHRYLNTRREVPEERKIEINRLSAPPRPPAPTPPVRKSARGKKQRRAWSPYDRT